MSKVYILKSVDWELNKYTEGVFSSFSAMVTWLKNEHGYESELDESSNEIYGVFKKETNLESLMETFKLHYEVHDLIGETSHKTDKLVIKGGGGSQ